ncbi:MAG: pyrrolo-quinoline quinone [Gammaproteobacteria bacterium]|nr:pyrrolo-quinoline quinone [Gammaproteobacteria bacterium]
MSHIFPAALALAVFSGATVAAAQGPTDADLRQPAPGDWLTYNRDLAGDRYSPLRQISSANASRLTAHCVLQLGEQGAFEASPLVFGGRIYLTTTHKTVAVNGATCEVLWSHTYVPADPEHLPGNRGVALYEGKLYRGTADAHLLALEAATGKVLWDVRVANSAEGYEVTGAPLAYDGKVFAADSGADTGIMGRVHAFDAATGKDLWHFNIVPVGSEAGAQTWGGGNVHAGGGSWSSMAIDAAEKLILVPTGNPAPDFDGSGRPGTNLYTDSVVALDLATGKLAWYVQQIPHDVHDWDTAAAPALYDSGGRSLMAVASKNGLLYLYDRKDRSLVAAVPYNTRENVDVPLRPDVALHVCPGALGEYNGPAYAPDLDMLFVGAADHCNTLQLKPPQYVPGQVYFGGVFRPDPPSQASGWVRGLEAGSGKERWAYHDETMVASGITVTGGGVVLAGDEAGWFLALDAKTGKVLYRFMTGGPVAGGISTYEAGGKEYIAVTSGNSSRDISAASAAATLVVFGLPER